MSNGGRGKLPAKKRLILQLIIGLVTLVSSIVNPSPTNATTIANIAKATSLAVLHVDAATSSGALSTKEGSVKAGTPAVATVEVEDSTVKDAYKNPKEIELIVKSYFKETPLMAAIAKCESHYQQTYKSGEVYRGRINSSDVGVMQINEMYHLKTAQKMGIDIYSLDGNMAYAKYLYLKEGSQPWVSSGACWDTSETARVTSAATVS